VNAVRRFGSGGGSALLVAVVLAFVLLPIVALITYQPLHSLFHDFGTKG
jgi:ABC-type phosphate transport system permease subunit